MDGGAGLVVGNSGPELMLGDSQVSSETVVSVMLAKFKFALPSPKIRSD